MNPMSPAASQLRSGGQEPPFPCSVQATQSLEPMPTASEVLSCFLHARLPPPPQNCGTLASYQGRAAQRLTREAKHYHCLYSRGIKCPRGHCCPLGPSSYWLPMTHTALTLLPQPDAIMTPLPVQLSCELGCGVSTSSLDRLTEQRWLWWLLQG